MKTKTRLITLKPTKRITIKDQPVRHGKHKCSMPIKPRIELFLVGQGCETGLIRVHESNDRITSASTRADVATSR
jgi:hypothetical protein